MHLSRKFFMGTTILAGAFVIAAPSFAQQQPPAPTNPATPPAAVETEGAEVEAVVVTGSRIKNNAFNSASPVQIITSEESELKGIPDAAAALLTSTVAAGSFQLNDQLTGFNITGGGGTQTLALRGLGTQRTLLLLNGRRAGPAGVRGQVQAFDLNVIPQAQVDRFDILKDGASSIYGSDAVAGVVNIITKRNLNGGAINAFASVPDDTGGAQYRADATYGRTFDQGYFTASLEYYAARPLRRMERSDTACAADYVFDPVTGERRDFIDPATGEYKCYALGGAGYVQTSAIGSIGQPIFNLVPMTSAYTYPGPALGNTSPYPGYARFARNGFPATQLYFPGDFEVNDIAHVISPQERYTLTLTGGWFLSPKAEVYTELLYNNRVSHQFGPAQIFPSFAQRTALNGAVNNLPASNPNNIFGNSNAFGLPGTNAVYVIPYTSENNQDVDYYRGVLGLRGDFNGLMGRDWSYDLYGQYSLSDAQYDLGPRLYLDRWLATSGPNVACNNNPAGGNFSGFDCAQLPGGVPWTSPRVLSGNFTDAERAFLFFTEDSFTEYRHAYVEGVLSTQSLFQLPAGDVGAAFGFQVRHEAIDDLPGLNARSRNVGLVSTSDRTKGSDDIRELFGELQLPILKDSRFGQQLDLNVSGRISDYESYGTSKTYKVGLNYALTDEYKFRASTGTSFRAPALYELFLGSQIGFLAQGSIDPCFNTDVRHPGPVIEAACAALGIPGTYVASGSSSAAIASVGGLGRLSAETAKTYNMGVVWTPKFMPLSVAVDYYAIEIKNAVSQFGAFDIISQCLEGNSEFCDLFVRDPTTFNIVSVNDSYVNIASQQNRGIDMQVRYRHEAPFNLGMLTIESQHNWKFEDKANVLGGVTDDYLGRTFRQNGPQYAGNLNMTLDKGSFTYFYGIDMIGHGSDVKDVAEQNLFGGHIFASARYADLLANPSRGSGDCNAPAATNFCVYQQWSTDFVAYHAASVRYRNNGYTLQVGVQNLFDKRPPQVNTGEFRLGTAMLNGYDMRGRRTFVRIGKTF
jgi:iron complex outermembrane recepter protein